MRPADTAQQPGGGAGPGLAEFVVLIALMTSMVAMSIDAMLPALPIIAGELGAPRINDSQYIITLFFAGMAGGQIFFGPLSDAIGRRPAILSGLLLFMAGCLMSMFAASFTQMLLGRFLQGLGAAGPRIVSIALVRDRYQGRGMARVMSFVMTVFILVPVFAPAIGQGMLAWADWQSIFGLFLLLALVAGGWFWMRQPETLRADQRNVFSPARLLLDTLGILRLRTAFGYSLTMGCVFGAFVGYLSSSQQIFQVQYGLGSLFPLYFGILAGVIGCASLLNARLVMRFGMRRLARLALATMSMIGLPFCVLVWACDGHPQLPLLMTYLMVQFFMLGTLFGNLNALAMEPLGHIAGLGSAVVGSLATLISVGFGILVAGAYDGTVLPLTLGFALLAIAALACLHWTEGAPST